MFLVLCERRFLVVDIWPLSNREDAIPSLSMVIQYHQSNLINQKNLYDFCPKRVIRYCLAPQVSTLTRTNATLKCNVWITSPFPWILCIGGIFSCSMPVTSLSLAAPNQLKQKMATVAEAQMKLNIYITVKNPSTVNNLIANFSNW